MTLVRRQPDITLAKKILGWQPTVERREGLLRTIELLPKFRQRVHGARNRRCPDRLSTGSQRILIYCRRFRRGKGASDTKV
jgi:hypothetical protein